MVKVPAKPLNSVLKQPMHIMVANNSSENGVSINECKEYMISLEKELDGVLKSKLTLKGMTNIGTKFFTYYAILPYLINL